MNIKVCQYMRVLQLHLVKEKKLVSGFWKVVASSSLFQTQVVESTVKFGQ